MREALGSIPSVSILFLSGLHERIGIAKASLPLAFCVLGSLPALLGLMLRCPCASLAPSRDDRGKRAPLCSTSGDGPLVPAQRRPLGIAPVASDGYVF